MTGLKGVSAETKGEKWGKTSVFLLKLDHFSTMNQEGENGRHGSEISHRLGLLQEADNSEELKSNVVLEADWTTKPLHQLEWWCCVSFCCCWHCSHILLQTCSVISCNVHLFLHLLSSTGMRETSCSQVSKSWEKSSQKLRGLIAADYCSYLSPTLKYGCTVWGSTCRPCNASLLPERNQKLFVMLRALKNSKYFQKQYPGFHWNFLLNSPYKLCILLILKGII